MSDRYVLPNATLVSAGNMASNITSKVFQIQNLDNVGIDCVIASGTPTGTYSVQVSIDYNPVTGTGDWSTLTTGSITSGSPAVTSFDLNQVSRPYVQLLYTASSGSGSLNAYICGKSI